MPRPDPIPHHRTPGDLLDRLRRRAKSWGRPRDPRQPPEASVPVPAIPPKGPLPMQGGAEAPLDFSD